MKSKDEKLSMLQALIEKRRLAKLTEEDPEEAIREMVRHGLYDPATAPWPEGF